ncbi:hypothetical protein LLT3_00635 [Lactococcus cremoris subsp. cremoris TIFN3]|uniref:Uncharacterized protein n=1 Tax=Lactococcus cremoris subsp. cremoris TIFN3 TaxID=1234873 RepID=T0V8D6_LACLC|nr:hypothetical protein LLT3_00635 [Lactococcus cremoris subsp. cremoris TIFN3]
MKEQVIELNLFPKEVENEEDVNITFYCPIVEV